VKVGAIDVQPVIDGLLVSPASPGAEVRRAYEEARGVPVYVAAFQDATGTALARARALAEVLGAARPGGALIETDIRSETEVDLFGQCALHFNDPRLELIDGKDFACGAEFRECLLNGVGCPNVTRSGRRGKNQNFIEHQNFPVRPVLRT